MAKKNKIKKSTKNIKINKSLAYLLLASILMMLGITINETIAEKSIDSSKESKFQSFYENKKNLDLEKKSEIRLDNVIKRIEKVINSKNRYKELFKDTIKKELNQLPDYKLRLALNRIQSKINSTKYNQLLNQNQSGNITAQLIAIKEIILEIQDNNNKIKNTINLNEIIK